MTDTPTQTEATVEGNGDHWSLSDMTRGATDRLNAINEKIAALRTMRQQINAQIKGLTGEKVSIERLMRAVEKPTRTRKPKAEKETTPADEG